MVHNAYGVELPGAYLAKEAKIIREQFSLLDHGRSFVKIQSKLGRDGSLPRKKGK